MVLSALRYQPFKTFYLTFELFTTLLIRLPFWILVSLPNSWRPRPSWTISRCVRIYLLRHAQDVIYRSGPIVKRPDHLAITPGVDVQGVWVDAVPRLIVGELKHWAEVATAIPTRIPGYWIHKTGSTIDVAASPMPGEKVVYALHGGAYITLSAHPSDPTAEISRQLLKHCDSIHRVFSIEYRLSAGLPNPPIHAFPAALLDALAGYIYLINVVGFSPNDIIIEGDSAGGNLALALVRYLVEYRDEATNIGLPSPPGGLLLSSPWCDLGSSQDTPTSSSTTCVKSDYIKTAGAGYPKIAFVGPHGMGAAEVNRYISPASVHPAMQISFKGFPKTFISNGGAECLRDQIRTLEYKMSRDMGEDNVTYREPEDAVHDYLVFAWHQPEQTDTFKDIATWVTTLDI